MLIAIPLFAAALFAGDGISNQGVNARSAKKSDRAGETGQVWSAPGAAIEPDAAH